MNSLLMNGDNDGLASRFLFVWPEPMPPIRPTSVFDISTLKSAFQKLDALELQERDDSFVPGVIKLTQDANEAHQAGRE